MSFTNCAQCDERILMDIAWISDQGILCPDCCRKYYPDRFSQPSYGGHSHEWKLYVGIVDKYEYCNCGEKRRS